MFWLENIFYYENGQKRYYLIKDIYVYDMDANPIPYHKVDSKKEYCLFPFNSFCKDVRELFLIDLNQKGILMLNGKRVATADYNYPVVKNNKLRVFTKIHDIDYEVDFKASYIGSRITQEKIKALEKQYRCEPTDELCKYNPHLHNAIFSKELNEIYEQFSQSYKTMNNKIFKKQKYEKSNRLTSNVHNGQQKLLISELEFFTKHTSPNKQYVVIYAGAAPGVHINTLQKLFPNIIFDLWDPSKFYAKLNKKIIVQNAFFTDKVANSLAQKYKGKKILFVSDIRRSTKDEDIAEDMRNQEKWVETIRPKAALLKFRLPWDDGKTNYLKGKLILQSWAPLDSSETRLEVIQKNNVYKRKTYLHRDYEERMAYFNRVIKNSLFTTPFSKEELGFNYDILKPTKTKFQKNIPMYDHCYDCVSEVYAILQYSKKYNRYFDDVIYDIYNWKVFEHFILY